MYRQIVGIPMGTNCVPLIADLFLYCYERDFMNFLNHENQAVMRQSACLVFNPITVDNYAAFFNCTPVGRASDSMMAPT